MLLSLPSVFFISVASKGLRRMRKSFGCNIIRGILQMLHLKGLRVYIIIEAKLLFAKSQGFGFSAGMRIGRPKSGVKPPHSKVSVGSPRRVTVKTASRNLQCRK